MQIHVTDDDPFSLTRGGALENVSLVKKYRMSEEDYDNRKGTLRWVYVISVTALTSSSSYLLFPPIDGVPRLLIYLLLLILGSAA